MTVYKRGKRWCYHLHVRVNGTSQQHKRSGFATQAEALRAERAKLSEVDGGVRLGASRQTVADYLATWLVRYAHSGAVKATTATTAASYVNTHLVPHLGSLTLAGLRRLHVEQAAGELLQSGLSPKTVRNVIGTLHKALSDAVRLELLPYNCASNVTLPKYDKRDVQPYDASEVSTLLQYVDAHDDLLTAAWWLALSCGLRRGELCGLRWCDVDLVRGELFVRVTRLQDRTGVFASTPKSRASVRTVALGSGVVDALARLRDRHDALQAQLGAWSHDQVLITYDAAPVRPATLTRHWHQVTQAAGLRRIRL
ncbi:MAG: site-specific integrase, partial [Gammaproteobacteria bacterium]|nr:site-specific integrase [Gammaproteobacteria bacterium]